MKGRRGLNRPAVIALLGWGRRCVSKRFETPEFVHVVLGRPLIYIRQVARPTHDLHERRPDHLAVAAADGHEDLGLVVGEAAAPDGEERPAFERADGGHHAGHVRVVLKRICNTVGVPRQVREALEREASKSAGAEPGRRSHVRRGVVGARREVAQVAVHRVRRDGAVVAEHGVLHKHR